MSPLGECSSWHPIRDRGFCLGGVFLCLGGRDVACGSACFVPIVKRAVSHVPVTPVTPPRVKERTPSEEWLTRGRAPRRAKIWGTRQAGVTNRWGAGRLARFACPDPPPGREAPGSRFARDDFLPSRTGVDHAWLVAPLGVQQRHSWGRSVPSRGSRRWSGWWGGHLSVVGFQPHRSVGGVVGFGSRTRYLRGCPTREGGAFVPAGEGVPSGRAHLPRKSLPAESIVLSVFRREGAPSRGSGSGVWLSGRRHLNEGCWPPGDPPPGIVAPFQVDCSRGVHPGWGCTSWGRQCPCIQCILCVPGILCPFLWVYPKGRKNLHGHTPPMG